MTALTTPEVGRPLPRETIRTTDQGYLAVCSAMYCDWQGLFPDRVLAVDALETHVCRACRQGVSGHAGQITAHLIELLDEDTARCATDSGWTRYVDPRGGGNPTIDFAFDFEGHTFPRTGTARDLDTLVETGDLIDIREGRQGKVWKVVETRSLGLPTWTILFVDPDREGWPNPETEWQRGRDQSWLNELVVVDGVATCRYDGEQHPVVGEDDEYQTLLGGFAADEGGESA